jgi:signal transduction histidine kinase
MKRTRPTLNELTAPRGDRTASDRAALQRAVTERLLLGALHDQDVARDAIWASERAIFLARASRELALSLDEETTRNTVRQLSLPRPGTWCIVDTIGSDGAIHRLPVSHPDPEEQPLAQTIEALWPPPIPDAVTRHRGETSWVWTNETATALLLDAQESENKPRRGMGFGSMLVVPLVVRAEVTGAMTFVSREGDPSFTAEETALAVDLAARCAMALDNARLFRVTEGLRVAADAANASKGEFLGNISHELRTPLNAIGGFTQLIEMGLQGPVTPEQHASLARIKSNQEHLLGLITEILEFTRAESGRIEYHHAAVPMVHALADVADMLRDAITERGVSLEGPFGPADAIAWADPDRVRQILLNLVMNAVKYGAAAGGTIALTAVVAGPMVVTSVADTGRGIPADKLHAIFQPFVQLHAGFADRRGGVGLGLAISRDLAQAMGGDLTVESTVDVGSRFSLALPLAP